jgi:hypothetical protein
MDLMQLVEQQQRDQAEERVVRDLAIIRLEAQEAASTLSADERRELAVLRAERAQEQAYMQATIDAFREASGFVTQIAPASTPPPTARLTVVELSREPEPDERKNKRGPEAKTPLRRYRYSLIEQKYTARGLDSKRAFCESLGMSVDTVEGIVADDPKKSSPAARQKLLSALGVSEREWNTLPE